MLIYQRTDKSGTPSNERVSDWDPAEILFVSPPPAVFIGTTHREPTAFSMAIQFCEDCGDTLPISAEKLVTCDCCGKKNKSISLRRDGPKCQLTRLSDSILQTVTNQKSVDFPSPLRLKLRQNIQQITPQDRQNVGATIQKECPKCNAPEVTYVELQLRSADEGSTIMYTCLRCREKSVNPFPTLRASY